MIDMDGEGKDEDLIMSEAILSTYEIENDDSALRGNPHLFEQLRGDYPVRREFDSYSIRATNVESEVMKKLKALGFNNQEL